MNRTIAYAHALSAATDCVFTFQMALDGPGTLDDYREQLRLCTRILRCCRQLFLLMNWWKAYPAYYMPIADAHISLREATRSQIIDRDGLLCACHYLERIILIDPRKGGRKDVA